jgi:hypothetical protein
MSRRRLRTGRGRTSLMLEALEPRILLDGAPQQQALQPLDALPAVFVENQGQWSDPSVRYGYSAGGVSVAMTDAGPVFQASQDAGTDAVLFSASFVGANVITPVGVTASEAVFNYFVGDEVNWRSGVPGYQTVDYKGLYDGIDLQVSGQPGGLKYEFDVAPGADYRQILVSYNGVDGLSIAADGSLRVQTAAGEMVEGAPDIYQMIEGQKVEAAGQFVLVNATTYAYEVTGPYDPSQELVIDPGYNWSSYLGGSGNDYGSGIAVDSSGNILVTGSTLSSNFGSANNGAHGNWDAFVAKLSTASYGYGVVTWVTYLGGSSNDNGNGIAVDSSGNALVTGLALSTDFAGHYNSYKGGSSDAFLAKVSPGGVLQWSAYVGGNGVDQANGIVLDVGGNPVLTGYTSSTNFYTTGSYHGGGDAFVAKFSTNAALLWATDLGGTSPDEGNSVTLDSLGNALVAGATQSSGFAGANNSYHGGSRDAFVAKVFVNGSLQWATYLGGSAEDGAYGIAADASGNPLVAGFTASTDFSGAYNSYHGGYSDAFVAKVSSGGVSQWATYVGGNGDDEGNGIALDSSGNAVVAGTTSSTDFAGAQNGASGGTNAFVAILPPGGSLRSAFCLDMSGSDTGNAIALDAAGDALVTGGSAVNSPTRGTDVFVAHVPTMPELKIWASGGTTVSAYDAGLSGGIDPDSILVKFGKDGSVSSITLGGTQSMSGLGIVISGASSVGSIKDGRKGPIGPLAFIASDGPIKSITLKSGFEGYNLNGKTLGGLTFAPDIDGDGDVSDSIAIYGESAIGKVSFGGAITADVWIGGPDSKGHAFSSFTSKGAGFYGDLTALGGGGKLSLGGNFVSNATVWGPLAGLQIKNGSFAAQLHVMGGLGKLAVSGWFCAGSNVVIEGLLKSATIVSCETDGGGDQFGIYANSFGKLTVGTWKLGLANLPFNQDDMWVDRITI